MNAWMIILLGVPSVASFSCQGLAGGVVMRSRMNAHRMTVEPDRGTSDSFVSHGRRNFMASSISLGIAGMLPQIAEADSTKIGSSTLSRFETDKLNLPSPSYYSEFNGIDNTYYPKFMLGEWEATQTLIGTSTPLGLSFVGGPNADLDIAQKSMEDAKSKLNIPVRFSLRYLPTKWGVAEDRLFNVQQRLDAFAGKKVVSSVQYADVGGSNRQTVLNLGGTSDDPLQTTLVYFKGPAAQKAFLVSHGGGPISTSSSNPAWSGYELQRSIFALTNQSTAPPITTDTEYIYQFEQIDENTIRGKLRIAEYLNAQRDKLFFEARNRAVSIQDYTLDLKRKG